MVPSVASGSPRTSHIVRSGPGELAARRRGPRRSRLTCLLAPLFLQTSSAQYAAVASAATGFGGGAGGVAGGLAGDVGAVLPVTPEASVAASAPSPNAAALGPNVLRPHVNGFDLISGGAVGEPVMLATINGGVRCSGGDGLEPPGYLLEGQVSLEDCASIANGEPHVKGFRWGRPDGLDSDLYSMLAKSEVPQQIDFERLFPSGATGGFHCFIYMYDESDHNISDDGASGAPEFEWTDEATRLKHFDTHSHRKEMSAMHMLSGGSKVCLQRWSVSRFMKPWDSSFWLCYVPETEQATCAKDVQAWHVGGQIFTAVCLTLCGVLAWIMHTQKHFMTCVNWVARFILYNEVALIVCHYLVNNRLDREGWTFYAVAIILVIAGGNVCVLPHLLLTQCQATKPLAALFLFVVAYSPVVFLDGLSYQSSLRLIMDHEPMLLGMLGFAIELLKLTFCCAPEEGEETLQKGSLIEPRDYMPMYQQ